MIIKNMLSWFNETYTCVVQFPLQFPYRKKCLTFLLVYHIYNYVNCF